MSRHTHADLRSFALSRPGAWQEIVAVAAWDDTGMTAEIPDGLLEQFSSEPIPVADARPPIASTAIPRAEWPLWASGLARLAIPGDRGLGDVASRLINAVGAARFESWHWEVFGRDCGCGDRRAWLNARFPLGASLLK